MSRVTIQQAVDVGVSHHSAGRLAEAEAVYRKVLAQDPQQADAMHLLGVIAHQCGQQEAAINLILKSLAIHPANPAAWTNLGEAYRVLGQLTQASDCYQKALEQQPDGAEAMGNLGLVYADLGRTDKAIELYRRAIAQKPALVAVRSNLGNAFLKKHDPVSALAAHDEALRRDPQFADGHNNRGSALEALDRLEEAAAAYMRAVELRPDFAIAANNVGNIMRRLSRWEEAMRWCMRSAEISPRYEQALWNIGLLELTAGNYTAGWRRHELRFTATPQVLPASLDHPRWNGEALEGRTILLYAEQGLGDGFQAARYVPIVAARGGRIVIECHKAQADLMRTLAGVVDVVVSGSARPAYDVFAPMMSLPMLFGTTLETIPRDVPYFKADAGRVDVWRARLAAYPGLKIGLVWRGRMQPEPLRSCSLAELAPLGGVAGATLFSLQVGEGSQELKNARPALGLIDLSADVVDFAETAACMMNLDLIITIDTAAAHLAGALARPTWVLLPFSPDWRWLLHRQDSPWYPTMRLFRQSQRKEWGDVVERVVEELRMVVERRE